MQSFDKRRLADRGVGVANLIFDDFREISFDFIVHTSGSRSSGSEVDDHI